MANQSLKDYDYRFLGRLKVSEPAVFVLVCNILRCLDRSRKCQLL
jgi:hypothetical protein